MATHAAHNPRRIAPKPREKGAAHGHVHHEKRHKTTEGRTGYVGAGAVLDEVGVYPGGNGGPAIPGVGLDSNGLTAYNSSGTATMTISSVDGSVTITGTGVITGGIIQTSVGFPKVRLDTTGLKAYNGAGVNTFSLDATTGNLTVNGTGVITGGTIQTSASNPRVIMDGTGLRAYNSGGTQTFSLSGTDGSLTVTGTGIITGATIQSSASNPRVVMDSAGVRGYDVSGTQRVNVGADGSFNLNNPAASITAAASGVTISSAASGISGARVVVSPTGIAGYNASNTQQFLLDSASGLITATGIINANAGSTLPWQTTGFFVGGGNLLSNASAEDPTTTSQLLYFNTGAAVTAGTFALQYPALTATSALNWNSTAAQVQTALNAAGVLPAGVTASCTGGPLPGTAVTITLAGFATPAPSVIAVSTQSLTGGSAVVGGKPVSWVQGSGVTDFIAYANSFHGGNALRLTATAAGTVSVTSATLSFAWTPGTTRYTLSTYLRAPTASRTPQLYFTWYDQFGGQLYQTSATATWNTRSDQWQRVVLTSTVPPATTEQLVTITGSPTGGSITLTYGGQTTAAIPFNATAAQVQTALRALSGIGSNVVTAGGPFPGSGVNVVFLNPLSVTPGALTFTNSLTGGTSPSVTITNLPATFLIPAIVVPSAASGEIFYVDAAQLEVGDVPTAFGPRPDEIVANTVTANMINVGQLSAISANIGTVTAGSLSSVTVTGAVVQTSASNPRVWMDTTGFFATNSSGTQTFSLSASTGNAVFTGTITGSTVTGGTVTGATVQTSSSNPRVWMDTTGLWSSDVSGNSLIGIDTSNGLRLTSGASSTNYLSWHSGSVAGAFVSAVNSGVSGTANNIQVGAYNQSVGASHGATLTAQADTASDTVNFVSVSVWNAAGSANYIMPIMNGAGQSAFIQAPGRNAGTYIAGRGASSINFPNSTVATQVSVSHGLGVTPTAIGFGINGAPLANITLGAASWNSSTMNIAGFSSVTLNGNINFFWIVMS